MRHLVVAAALTLAGGCGPVVEDPPYEPDVERACGLQCTAYVGCRRDIFEDVEECVASCVQRVFWKSPCNREYETQIECRGELTCEELEELSMPITPDGPQPEDRRCWDVEIAFESCNADNPLDE